MATHKNRAGPRIGTIARFPCRSVAAFHFLTAFDNSSLAKGPWYLSESDSKLGVKIQEAGKSMSRSWFLPCGLRCEAYRRPQKLSMSAKDLHGHLSSEPLMCSRALLSSLRPSGVSMVRRRSSRTQHTLQSMNDREGAWVDPDKMGQLFFRG